MLELLDLSLQYQDLAFALVYFRLKRISPTLMLVLCRLHVRFELVNSSLQLLADVNYIELSLFTV